MNVGVIGAGAWGTALAICAARGGSDVVLWSYDGEYKQFDGIELPENIKGLVGVRVLSNNYGKPLIYFVACGESVNYTAYHTESYD